MLQRFFGAVCLAIALAVVFVQSPAAARGADEGYELWSNCGELPDSFDFLPIYLGNEAPGFVDLGRAVGGRGGLSWRAMQYTRDKDFGPVRVTMGRWYGGMGADRWPVGTINPVAQFAAFRVTAWEIDGTRYPVDPSCLWTFTNDELSFGLYNVWVRFTEPGVHRLRIFGRQAAPFYFIYPFALMGGADPFGLDGRRVFLPEEIVGDLLDEEFVHVYELHVGTDLN
jgi:hypothetical protein